MFSQIFIARPKFAIVISLIMILAGAISLVRLPVAEYPEIAPPKIYVQATYVGASAQEIADTIAAPLEAELNGLEDMLYFNSTSNDAGMYSCSLTFKTGTNSDIAMVNVQNAVKRAEPKLPAEVTKVGVTVGKRSSDILAMIAFRTDYTKLNVAELNHYVTVNVKDHIARLKGVASVDVMAAQEYSMRIWLDTVRMSGLNVTIDEVRSAIARQNVQAAAGSVGNQKSNPYLTYKLNLTGRLKTVEEFEEIIVRNDEEGNVVYLRDISRVELGAKDYIGESYFMGEESVAMAIYRLDDANALETVNDVKNQLDQLGKNFPQGVSYTVAFDPTEFISITIKEIVVTLISALILVVLITYLFLQDWRATLIPALAIPVALLGTFPFMLAIGFSINVLTMFGLILVIGSLVDDAIVVVENTQGLMEREGLGPREAASKSMMQITGAIIATTLVTVACYVPLAFYGGMVGTIYTQFAVTMCISLCLSTVVAMTLSPALCSRILRKPKEKKPVIFAPFNFGLDLSRKVYLGCVKLLVRRALLTVLLFAGVIAANYYAFNSLPDSFLPPEDKGAVFCDIELASGATLERTRSVVNRFREEIVANVDGIESDLSVVGFSFLNGLAENNGLMIIKLKHWDERTSPELEANRILAVIQGLGAQVPEARITCFTPPAIMGLGITGGASLMFTATGDITPEQLADEARNFNMKMMGDPDVLYSTSSFNTDTPQLFFELDRAKAESLGVQTSTIFSTLQSKLASFYVNDFNIQGFSFYVKMQSDMNERSSFNDILNVEIPNRYGDMVPLSSLGKLEYITGPRQIQRFNKQMAASTQLQAKPGTISSGELMRRVENMDLPEGYVINWTEMSYEEKENQGQIMFLMALAMIFAYLFLVAQYESWTIPIPVMLSVMFATLGALLGLHIWNESLSIYAQLGLVMLIGLAAKNAILMVEFSKQEREQGKPIFESAVRGAELRYRAVLMTAWSFVFGVYPLVIASGAGSGSRRAIGIPTFSGMILATIIGIIFVPALYAVCQRIREFFNRKVFHTDKSQN